MLQERMKQSNDDVGVSSSSTSRWKSARPEKGSVTNYAKDVQGIDNYKYILYV